MGLLDDLKKQADAVKSQQVSQKAMTADAIKLVEKKMKQSFLYLNELLKQFAVLKPQHPAVFSVPGVGDFKDLKFASSFIDYRRKKIGDQEYFDTVNFHIRWQGGENLVVERDMPGAITRTRDALWQYRAKFTEEEIRSDRGSVVRTRFNVQAAIVTDVVVKADHDKARLLVSANNMNRLGTETFDVPAPDISEPLLEEFARMLMGQNSEFRKYRSATPLR